MIIEGFVNYQTVLDKSYSKKQSGNFLCFSNAYFSEEQFLNRKSHIDFFLGGIDRYQTTKCLTNIELNDTISSKFLSEILSENTKDKPKIGVWYNETTHKTQLSRDIFGEVPFFYIHIPNQFLAFSTHFINLVTRKEVKEYLKIDLNKIISYTSDIANDPYSDISDTFFTQIKSVLPGHLLTITKDGILSSTAYETFNLQKWAHLETKDDFSSAVRKVMIDSVSKNTDFAGQIVGSHLSGGLDSSSVSSTFKFLFPQRPLHTFHIKATNKESDESDYAASVAENIHSIHHEIAISEDDLFFLKLSTSLLGQPEPSFISPASNLNTMRLAKDTGCDILLNGHGGDSIIGSGMELFDQAFEEKNWSDLKRLLRKRIPYFISSVNYPNWGNYSSEKKYRLILQNFLYSRISSVRNMPLKKIFTLYLEVEREMGISLTYFIRRASGNFLLRLLKKNVISKPFIVKDEILGSAVKRVNETNNESHTASLLNGLPTEYKELFGDVFNEYGIHGLEQYFVIGNHYGISIRSPFLNKDLFELCMAVPDVIKFGEGKGREHLREAMKGILVENVRNRSTKITLSSPDGEEMTLRLFNQAKSYLEPDRDVWNYIDREKYAKQLTILRNRNIPYIQKSKIYFHITRTISLSVWLEWVKENKILP